MTKQEFQNLFLEKLYSLNSAELASRLDRVTPTGLGDIVDERQVYQYLYPDTISISFSRTTTKTKQILPRYYAEFHYTSSVITASSDAVLLAA